MNKFILIALLVGMVIGFWFSRRQGSGVLKRDKGGSDLIERQRREKAMNLEKILEYFERMNDATNSDIQELLGVSDATVTRYMEELEREGRIRQVGVTGRYVHYEIVN